MYRVCGEWYCESCDLSLHMVVLDLLCVLVVKKAYFFFQAEDGRRELVRSRGLGDVCRRQVLEICRENMDAMIGACEAAGVKLAVSYQRRMSPENQTLQKLLENGSLGRFFAADMRVKFWRDEAYYNSWPLYTSDAADDPLCVNLRGRQDIKKKKLLQMN